ncbi:hypothetical protein [Candidatus Cyanaurora vandensis]|uniref:hypothetical protein n=1 Tax=Candidatus Cyanaurora vandensis TaxID=2714958 RepID=UPI00257B03FC|nr:hypothetical protein [Candidatus Cyanaurora vandensis]
MAGRSVKLNLSEQGSQDLKEVAQSLGLTETEVLRKGLQLVGLYTKIKKDKSGALLLKHGDTTSELILS